MGVRDRAIQLQREIEWRRCARDEAYFLRTYYRISHPSKGSIFFELRDAQAEALVHWEAHRYSLTLKARQIGWSTLVAAHCVWLCLFHDDQNVIMLSRTERESISLLRKGKYGYARLPEWMLARGPRQLTDHSQKMIFSNGSQIVSMPSASDPARGESATLVVVDEWAFLPNPEDAWASIEPVADIGGRIIGLSTANGSGNFFHHKWVESETGNNFFSTMFYPWSAVTERDQAWYEAKRRSMPSWQLHQEYPSNAEQAFIRSGRTVFDIDDLDLLEPVEAPCGHLHEITGIRNVAWDPDLSDERDDVLTVWEPPQIDQAYCIGADVAEGLDHGDYSSAHVLKATTGQVVAVWHGHVPADRFGHELAKLGWWYNTALIGPESNNHGLTAIVALRREGYPRIYRRRRLNSSGRVIGSEFGWATNVGTKPLMIDELGMAIREGGVLIPDYDTIAELKTYVRDDKGKMHGSPYDDRVMSLALGVQMLKHVHAPEYATVESDAWSFDWWDRGGYKEYLEPERTSEWRIGVHSVR